MGRRSDGLEECEVGVCIILCIFLMGRRSIPVRIAEAHPLVLHAQIIPGALQ